jgi:hypothetical protein
MQNVSNRCVKSKDDMSINAKLPSWTSGLN